MGLFVPTETKRRAAAVAAANDQYNTKIANLVRKGQALDALDRESTDPELLRLHCEAVAQDAREAALGAVTVASELDKLLAMRGVSGKPRSLYSERAEDLRLQANFWGRYAHAALARQRPLPNPNGVAGFTGSRVSHSRRK